MSALLQEATDEALERRSWRLANGLVGLGLTSADCIAVLCCASHADDFLVGYSAIRKLSATAVLISPDAAAQAAMLPPWARPRAVLACPEGWEAWHRGGGGGLVITDAPLKMWWKALEARASEEPWPLTANGSGREDLVVEVDPDGTLEIRTVPPQGWTE